LKIWRICIWQKMIFRNHSQDTRSGKRSRNKVVKEYLNWIKSYQEFLSNFTLDGYKSSELKDALEVARKRKEEFIAKVEKIKEKYPTEFKELDEEEELKIMSDALKDAEAITKKLEKIEDK